MDVRPLRPQIASCAAVTGSNVRGSMKSIASACTLASDILVEIRSRARPCAYAGPARQKHNRITIGSTWAGPLPRLFRSRDLEYEPAGHGVRFREPNLDILRQAEHLAGPASGQGLLHFIMMPEIVGERGHRNKSRGPAVRHGNEQTETGHARNARREPRANLIGHEGGEVPVDRVPFGQRRSPLGRGDVRRGIGEPCRLIIAEPARTEPQGR